MIFRLGREKSNSWIVIGVVVVLVLAVVGYFFMNSDTRLAPINEAGSVDGGDGIIPATATSDACMERYQFCLLGCCLDTRRSLTHFGPGTQCWNCRANCGEAYIGQSDCDYVDGSPGESLFD